MKGEGREGRGVWVRVEERECVGEGGGRGVYGWGGEVCG